MEAGKWEQRGICFCVLSDSKMTLYKMARDIGWKEKKLASFLLEMKTHYWNHWGK